MMAFFVCNYKGFAFISGSKINHEINQTTLTLRTKYRGVYFSEL